MEKCFCNGDESKCTFYTEKRKEYESKKNIAIEKFCMDIPSARCQLVSDLLTRIEAAEAAQETLQKSMTGYKARAERAEKCIAEIEEALKFGRVSAAMLQICEWRW